jgi:gamma-butyrobetaine dioxygenase
VDPEIQWDGRALCIDWPDGHRSVYPSLWLRDNCPEDRDSRTGQRLLDVTALPARPVIEEVDAGPESVEVRWKDEPRASRFGLRWLRANCGCDEHDEGEKRRFWTAAGAPDLYWMDYAAVCAIDQARGDWLTAIARDGLAFLRGVPARSGEVLEAARLLGYVIETNYGRTFDVREVPDPNNLAYTAIELGLHTDNPYRDPVPGWQLLHCLEPGSDGGESLFVDGFAVANTLRSEDPEAFQVLTHTPVAFALRDTSVSLEARRPLIELEMSGRLKAVHYNNRSIEPIRLSPRELIEFYRAYLAFAKLLKEDRFQWQVKLGKGELVVFDNHRILHGRHAFMGPRHFQGCYVGREGLFSNLAVLNDSGRRNHRAV